MAKIYITCCSRCGAAHDHKDWTTNSSGRRLHLCPDGIAGSEGEYDELHPETKPKLAAIPGDVVPPDPVTVIWKIPLVNNDATLDITDHMLFHKLVQNETALLAKGKTIDSTKVNMVRNQCAEYVACAIEGGEAMVGYTGKINKAIKDICDDHAEKSLREFPCRPNQMFITIPLKGGGGIRVTEEGLYTKMVQIEYAKKNANQSYDVWNDILAQCRDHARIAMSDPNTPYPVAVKQAIDAIIDDHAEKALEDAITAKYDTNIALVDMTHGMLKKFNAQRWEVAMPPINHSPANP